MKRSKLEIIFLILSFCFIFGLIITYSSRGVYYYLKENGTKKIETKDLSSEILKNINKENIYYKGDSYNVIGNIENNYIFYSGILWRVISLNDSNISVISDDSITLLPYGSDGSILKSWFNDNKTELTKYETILNKLCEQNCEEYMSLLTSEKYELLGGENSYLNNKKNWWVTSTDGDSWYVKEDGTLSKDSNNHMFGVRPIINIKNIEYIYGDGTKNNPFVISNDPINSLKEAELGSYISYDNYIWKIVSKKDNIKLIMVDSLESNGNIIKKSYSNINNYFNLNDRSGIAYYLNNNFYNSLNKKYLVKGKYNIGKYNSYSYDELYNQIEAYVGLLNVGDIFLNENDNMYLLSGNTNDLKTISILKENDSLYLNFINYKSEIRPVIYLNKDAEVVNGTGNESYPYELR